MGPSSKGWNGAAFLISITAPPARAYGANVWTSVVLNAVAR
ncbi:MAG: hypothetical protein OJF52_001178 [Nitrospira sp.]|jgi:hypothetical protein|nr:MAG: hypothetical protein OJF52_001178 [Nitrospira sp.]